LDTDGSPGAASVLKPDEQDRLLVAAGVGDKAAFRTLLEHFAPRIKAYLLRAGAPHAGAEGVVQDIMLTVWRSAAEYDPAWTSAAAWIFAITRNRRIALLRREKRPEIDPDDPDLQPARHHSEAAARLRDTIKTLPIEQWEALFEALFDATSTSNAATRSESPSRMQNPRLRLALERLRLELKEDH
jgi:RNA polymerase sigma-70 factor (ECF subfamily)